MFSLELHYLVNATYMYTRKLYQIYAVLLSGYVKKIEISVLPFDTRRGLGSSPSLYSGKRTEGIETAIIAPQASTPRSGARGRDGLGSLAQFRIRYLAGNFSDI